MDMLTANESIESPEDLRQLLARVERALERLQPADEYVERVAVKTGGGGFAFLEVGEIDWIDAAGNYVRLNAGGKRHLRRDTMASLEQQLDPARFIRIHRSTIVNIDRIREVRPRDSGELLVVLEGGQRLNLGRSYRERFARLLGRTSLSHGDSGADRD